MAIQPTKLRPSELVQILNSTPAGEVLTDRKLAAHRKRAGLRIGDGKTVNLLRYVAWLAQERHGKSGKREAVSGKPENKKPPRTLPVALPSPAEDKKADAYRRHRDQVAEDVKIASALARDIGPLPAVVDPARKEACGKSLGLFCRTYFPGTFYLPFSDGHKRVIEKIEQTVHLGGQTSIGMPRGSGKTALCEKAELWAMVYGYRRFGLLIGAEQHIIRRSLKSIKTAIETNDLLFQDFPEVCYPVRRLGRINQRAMGQTYQGKPTYIEWTEDQIVLPLIEGSKASCACITVAGITSAFRGIKFTRMDNGSEVRPDLVLVDDPQTRESAKSPTQCGDREEILSGDIGGLAEPGVELGVLAAVTIIYPDDMSDRILDQDKHPEWHGETTRTLLTMPTDEKLWEEYAELRRKDHRLNDRTFERSNEFYRKHRKKLDAGAEAAWPQRYNKNTQSAIQHAMNFKIDKGDTAFWSEMQNEPRQEELLGSPLVKADVICKKLNGIQRGVVPTWAHILDAFIDVGDLCHAWCIVAWRDDFTGAVIDYGTWPSQPTRHFAKYKLSRTLSHEYPGAGLDGWIRAGLVDLSNWLASREFQREDGGASKIDVIGIDTGHKPEIVHNMCRSSEHAAVLMPTRGRGISAAARPMSEWDNTRGDRIGFNWVRMKARNHRGRTLWIDTNFWKTFLHQHYQSAIGDPGSISLYGRSPSEHETFAAHQVAEAPSWTQGNGREVWVWTQTPGRENEFFDCMVGCAAVASYLGAAVPGTEVTKPKRKREKWSAIQARKLAAAGRK